MHRSFIRLEQCLLPAPEIMKWNGGNIIVERYSTMQKVAYYVKNFFVFIVLLIALPVTLLIDYFTERKVVPVHSIPKDDTKPVWPPEQRGFATSLFQTSGIGTRWGSPKLRGKGDWDEWMQNPLHVAHSKDFRYENFFTDILSDPSAYIEMLKKHHVTAHRFSLEWSVIEPKKGEIDEEAVKLYRNFIKKLIEAGITPSVTLSHFVLPEWFYKSGGFQRVENIDLYLNFALKAMELFPEVKDWWSFNELGIKAFQQTREVYPTDVPEGSSLSTRVHAAAISTRNMLIAHCKLHKAVSERFPKNKIGVTHQWLKIDTATGNLLERLIAYIFTKFAFTPVYQFFKEGHFLFQIPFMANVQFEIPKEEFEENHHFLMRLGVQTYPQAMVKMGLSHGEKYPCTKSFMGLSFGSSCEPGGVIMSFGPRWKAEGIDKALDEAFALTDKVYITEFGSDARVWKWGKEGFEVDDEAQKEYLQQLFERIRLYSERNHRKIYATFCWSDLHVQLEWENGHKCRLGTVTPTFDEKRGRIMTGHIQSPAAKYLEEAFRGREVEQLTA